MELIMMVAFFLVVFSLIANIVGKEFNKKTGIKAKHLERTFFFLFQVFAFLSKQIFYLLRFIYQEVRRFV